MTELSECEAYSIIVEPRSNTSNASFVGVPPYYLIAFIPNGVPTTSMIGSDPNNLTWQVNQATGNREARAEANISDFILSRVGSTFIHCGLAAE